MSTALTHFHAELTLIGVLIILVFRVLVVQAEFKQFTIPEVGWKKHLEISQQQLTLGLGISDTDDLES